MSYGEGTDDVLQVDGTQTRCISIDEALNLVPWGRFHRLLFFTCGLGYAADMCELMLLGFALPELILEWDLSTMAVSMASLFSNLGIMCGAIGWGVGADRLGRKMAFLGSVALTFICGLASAASPAFWVFVLCRFGVGCGLGGNLAVDYTMFMEFIPCRLRGKVMMLLTMWGVLGVLLVAVASGLVIPTAGWRAYVAVLSIPSFLLLVLRLAVPESPTYLHAHGRTAEAWEVIQQMATRNGTTLPAGLSLRPLQGGLGQPRPLQGGLEIELDSRSSVDSSTSGSSGRAGGIRRRFAASRSVASQLLEPILSHELRGTTLLLNSIWFLMNIGYGGFTLWLPFLLEGRGISKLHVYRSYAIMVLAEVPGLLMSTALVSWASLGKKWILAFAAMGCFVTLASCALVSGEASVTAASASMYFFSVSAWASLYIITPESYPARCRSSASGSIRFWGCVGGMVQGPLGAWLLERGVWTPLLVFAGCYAVIAGLAACFLHGESDQGADK